MLHPERGARELRLDQRLTAHPRPIEQKQIEAKLRILESLEKRDVVDGEFVARALRVEQKVDVDALRFEAREEAVFVFLQVEVGRLDHKTLLRVLHDLVVGFARDAMVRLIPIGTVGDIADRVHGVGGFVGEEFPADNFKIVAHFGEALVVFVGWVEDRCKLGSLSKFFLIPTNGLSVRYHRVARARVRHRGWALRRFRQFGALGLPEIVEAFQDCGDDGARDPQIAVEEVVLLFHVEVFVRHVAATDDGFFTVDDEVLAMIAVHEGTDVEQECRVVVLHLKAVLDHGRGVVRIEVLGEREVIEKNTDANARVVTFLTYKRLDEDARSFGFVEDEELNLDGFLRAFNHLQAELQSRRSGLESFYLVLFSGVRVGGLCVRKGIGQSKTQEQECFYQHHAQGGAIRGPPIGRDFICLHG